MTAAHNPPPVMRPATCTTSSRAPSLADEAVMTRGRLTLAAANPPDRTEGGSDHADAGKWGG